MESKWVHSARRPPIGLLYLPLVIMRMENLVERWLARETEVLGENLPQWHFVYHKSHMTWPDANTDHHGGKPTTNRLSYSVTGMYVDQATVRYPWQQMKRKGNMLNCKIIKSAKK
jgi:hypothetical protein